MQAMGVQESPDLPIGIFQFGVRKLTVAAAFDRHQFVSAHQPRKGHDAVASSAHRVRPDLRLHEYLGPGAVRLEHRWRRDSLCNREWIGLTSHPHHSVAFRLWPGTRSDTSLMPYQLMIAATLNFSVPSQLLSSPVPSGSIPVIKDRCPPAE